MHLLRRIFRITLCCLLGTMLVPQGGWVAMTYAEEAAVPAERDGWVIVSTEQQLDYMNMHQEQYLDANIRLVKNLDLTGHRWLPFGGNEYAAYSGIFDGRGHTITGIVISGEREHAGFFGKVSGEIRNVGVVVDIQGGRYTGGLVALLDGGTIDRSFSQGRVQGGNGGNVSCTGGLAGVSNHSSITRSFSTAEVQSGTADNIYAGGLSGAQGEGFIRHSYATGYVHSPVTDNGYVFLGGLVGHMVYGTLEFSYASGKVGHTLLTTATMGGFLGVMFFSGSVNHAYFNLDANERLLGVGGDASGTDQKALGLSAAAMREALSFEGWDFDELWTIDGQVNDGYPYLRPAILTEELPQGRVGMRYEANADGVDGASGGLSWQASGLPGGLEMDGMGRITGLPEESGAFSVVLTATDRALRSTSATLQLVVVEPAPPIHGFAVHPGVALGSTSVSAEPQQAGTRFAYRLERTEAERPMRGEALPEGTAWYTPGGGAEADITDVRAGEYLILYETDGDGLIQRWSSLLLEATHIRQAVPVLGVRISEERLVLKEHGQGRQLTAIVEPDDATNSSVAWQSSHPDVAQIGETGWVKPGTPGTASIQVATVDGGYTATVLVTVQPDTAELTALITQAEDSLSLTEEGNSPGQYPTSARVKLGEAIAAAKVVAGYERATKDEVAEAVRELNAALTLYRSSEVPVPDAPVWTAGELSVMEGTTTSLKLAWPAAQAAAGISGYRIYKNDETVPVAVISSQEERIYVLTELSAGARYTLTVKAFNAAGEGTGLSIAAKTAADTSALLTTIQQALLRLDSTVEGARAGQFPPSAREMLRQAIAAAQEKTDAAAALQEEAAAATVKLEQAIAAYNETEISLAPPAPYYPSLTDGMEGGGRGPDDGKEAAAEPEPESEPAQAGEHSNPLDEEPHVQQGWQDVAGHWAEDAVKRALALQLVKGYPDQTFRPNRPVTRAEFIVMLARAMHPQAKGAALSFSDKEAIGAWTEASIAQALELGWIDGYADGSFRPDQPISRAEMAVVTARALGMPASSQEASTGFKDDALLPPWAKSAIRTLHEHHIVSGRSAGRFEAQEEATRAEAITVLLRLLEHVAKDETVK